MYLYVRGCGWICLPNGIVSVSWRSCTRDWNIFFLLKKGESSKTKVEIIRTGKKETYEIYKKINKKILSLVKVESSLDDRSCKLSIKSIQILWKKSLNVMCFHIVQNPLQT